LERDDEILNLAVVGNHLFHPQSLKRRGLTTAHISKPRTRSTATPYQFVFARLGPPHLRGTPRTPGSGRNLELLSRRGEQLTHIVVDRYLAELAE